MTDVTVVDLSFQGLGVVREPSLCFVAGALPDEQVSIGPLFGRKKFLQANLLSVIRPSDDRREPPCAYFQQCGGCQLQHMRHSAQLAFKKKNLRQQLYRFAGKQDFPEPDVISGDEFYWRSRVRLQVVGSQLGFFARQTHQLVPIDLCMLVTPGINRVITLFTRWLNVHSHELSQIELAEDDHGQIGIYTQGRSSLSSADWCELSGDTPSAALLWWHQVSSADGAGHPVGAPIRLHADDIWLSYHLLGLTFRYTPLYFTQVNAGINARMLTQALSWLQLTGSESVLDLFCGMGNFSLPIAKVAQKVLGIELSDMSVAQARLNASENHIQNASFLSANLDRPKGRWLQQPWQAVVLDPPRKGAADVIKALDWQGVQKVLYVSCNVTTLAQDLLLLQTQGFAVVRSSALDMFPNSYHTEAMVLLTKGGQ